MTTASQPALSLQLSFDASEEMKSRKHPTEYKLGDIVELRRPRRVLGVIKYIGKKKDIQGNDISVEDYYLIQLAANVGNSDGEFRGYQYITSLRPKNTCHFCMKSDILRVQSKDNIIKALYNMLYKSNKLKKAFARLFLHTK